MSPKLWKKERKKLRELAGAKVLRNSREEETVFRQKLEKAAQKLKPGQKYFRGLFSGGTLCQEAQLILSQTIACIYSNIAQQPELKLKEGKLSRGNTLVDLGEDEFTLGTPHPMIDYTLRCKRIREEAEDPEVAIILLDVVLGYGSHPNPAEPLSKVIKQVRSNHPEREIIWLASLCGLDEDPQNYSKQKEALESLGVIIAPTNAAAARGVALVMKSAV
jgi:FdrA protein